MARLVGSVVIGEAAVIAGWPAGLLSKLGHVALPQVRLSDGDRSMMERVLADLEAAAASAVSDDGRPCEGDVRELPMPSELTQSEAALLLGVSIRRVGQLRDELGWPARRVGRAWLIEAEAVEAHAEARDQGVA